MAGIEYSTTISKHNIMEEREDKIRYNVASYRLHDGTKEEISKLKMETGLSYNRLFNKLVEHYKETTFN